MAHVSSPGTDAPLLLLEAARRLEPLDPALARETYLVAWGSAGITGDETTPELLTGICHAARAIPPPPGAPRPLELLLEGLALLTSDGHAAAAPTLQRAADELSDLELDEVLWWGWMAAAAGCAVWDFESQLAIAVRQVQLVREAGALADLPRCLTQLGLADVWMGDLGGAASVVAECDSLAAATGSRVSPYVALRLRAAQGREAEAAATIAAVLDRAAAAGRRTPAAWAHWAGAVLNNGLGRHEAALAAARRAAADTVRPWPSMWALPELVEAAARCGEAELAEAAFARLAQTTEPCANDVARGIEARSRALVRDGDAAEELHREAVDRLSRTRLRPELARAQLLFGEWLREQGRSTEARDPLAAAEDALAAIGMEAFADRARRELVAAGARMPRRTAEPRDALTPQEEQIARLARTGLTNSEIGAQLFLSPRTVEWHLHKVFAKLGIDTRGALLAALPDAEREVTPA